MALTKILNSNIGESFTEMYGIAVELEAGIEHLKIIHTNGGNDDVSKEDYDKFVDLLWASTGYTFSLENGHFIITI